jgi:hypothetical protein
MQELKACLKTGAVARAYREILAYMARLRVALLEQAVDRSASGIYQGHLDITHFALFPEAFKARGLKLTILFNYEDFCFEAWLTARNQKLGQHYWKLLHAAHFDHYPLIQPAVGHVALFKVLLANDFSLALEEPLTANILASVAELEAEVIGYLDRFDPR